MTAKAAHQATSKRVSRKDEVDLRMLAMDFLDVSWRIAIPVIACAVAGIFIDNALAVAPLFTLSGTVTGFAIAWMLVGKQLLAIGEIPSSKLGDKK